MKKIVITTLVVVSAFLQAADDRRESDLMKRARAAIASKDQDSMDEQLTLIASFPDADAHQAIQLLLDAGANGAYTKNHVRQGLFCQEEYSTSPLLNAALSYAHENIRVLREWSEAHTQAIDPNQSINPRYNWGLLPDIVNRPNAHSRLSQKVLAIQALLQFSNIEVDKPSRHSQTALYHAVEKLVSTDPKIHFEAYCTIIRSLIEHGAAISNCMLEMVDSLQHHVSVDQYEEIMGVLSPGSATKPARTK